MFLWGTMLSAPQSYQILEGHVLSNGGGRFFAWISLTIFGSCNQVSYVEARHHTVLF